METLTSQKEKTAAPAPVTRSGSQAVLDAFLAEGVDTVFGYPGGAIMPIYDALYDYNDRLKHILVRHEQGAVHAAEGYARSSGKVGVVRRDPFAMLPFCGYNMSDYFQHWLDMEHKLEESGHSLPKIFCVNWFRKDEAGKFVWPGYGENMRVLEWMLGRIEGQAGGADNLFGTSPRYEDMRWDGLCFTREQFNSVIGIDKAAWQQELVLHAELFQQLEQGLPAELPATKARIEARLAALEGCYRQAVQQSPAAPPRGGAVLSFSVTEDGNATAPRLLLGGAPPALKRCMEQALSDARFPRPDIGPAQVTVQLTLFNFQSQFQSQKLRLLRLFVLSWTLSSTSTRPCATRATRTSWPPSTPAPTGCTRARPATGRWPRRST